MTWEKKICLVFFFRLLHSDPAQWVILGPIILLYQPAVIGGKVLVIHHLSTRQIRSPPSETPGRYHAVVTLRKKGQVTSCAPRRHESDVVAFYIASTPV